MNFNQPPALVPTPEREPRFPTLAEIQEAMDALHNTSRSKPPRIKTGPDGQVTLVEYTIENPDGAISLFSYRSADSSDGYGVIDIVHFSGSPDDGDYLGSDTLAHYNGKAGVWIHPPKHESARATDPSVVVEAVVMEDKKTGHLLLVNLESAPPTKNYGESTVALAETSGENAIDTVRNMEVEALLALFDQAETTFGAKSMEETLLREADNLPAALEARNKTKPILNNIYSKMIGLNRSKGQTEPLSTWNPDGDLTEEQFNDLNTRRIALSNMLGILHKDESGKIVIRHDLNAN